MKNTTLAVFAALLIAGCAHRAPVKYTYTPLPFDEAEYNALPKVGTGIIKGQVFAKTVGGDVKKGAGNEVTIVMATKYGDQWYREDVSYGRFPSAPPDERYSKYRHTKVTDGEGRFEFTDLPAGSYYVISSVTWQVPTRGFGGTLHMNPQGGMVMRNVDVHDGAVTEAMLSK